MRSPCSVFFRRTVGPSQHSAASTPPPNAEDPARTGWGGKTLRSRCLSFAAPVSQPGRTAHAATATSSATGSARHDGRRLPMEEERTGDGVCTRTALATVRRGAIKWSRQDYVFSEPECVLHANGRDWRLDRAETDPLEPGGRGGVSRRSAPVDWAHVGYVDGPPAPVAEPLRTRPLGPAPGDNSGSRYPCTPIRSPIFA